MPVAVIQPSDSKSCSYKSQIRDAALDAELLHAVFAGKYIRDKAGRQGNDKSASTPEQTTYGNKHRHAVGKEVKNTCNQIDSQTYDHYPHFIF